MSQEAKQFIVHLHLDLGFPISTVASLVPSPRGAPQVQERTCQGIIDTLLETGGVGSKKPYKERSDKKITGASLTTLIQIVEENPWLFLDEIALQLKHRCNVVCTGVRCYLALKNAGYNLKVMRRIAAQRDEHKRDLYWEQIYRTVTFLDQLVFADETAKDTRTLWRRRGWGKFGAPVDTTQFLIRGKHVSILALYGMSGFIDYHHKEGGYKAEDFIEAVQICILPHLQQWPLPRSVLVLDNCGIHKKYRDALEDMVEARGARVIFLAPYSPIDNPIEMAFSAFKACWRRNAHWLVHTNDYDAIRFCMKNCHKHLKGAGSHVECYRHCGYQEDMPKL